MLIVDVCVCVFKLYHSSIHLFVYIVVRIVSQYLIVVVSVVQFKCLHIYHI